MTEEDEGSIMDRQTRESRLNTAFVLVADTLTDDYDVVELLHVLVSECTAIVNAQAGGVMLADADGNLQVVASTSESAELVEVLQLAAGAGPCLECFADGKQVLVADIAASAERWPEFAHAAPHHGFLSVHAIPMRLRGDTIGTMNLFGTSVGGLSDRDAAAAQALADVATIGIIQERLSTHAHLVAEQLQRALESRILIEQAKGAVAQTLGASMEEAFTLLRRFSRDHNVTLRTVSTGIVNRTLSVDAIVDASHPAPRPR